MVLWACLAAIVIGRNGRWEGDEGADGSILYPLEVTCSISFWKKALPIISCPGLVAGLFWKFSWLGSVKCSCV